MKAIYHLIHKSYVNNHRRATGPEESDRESRKHHKKRTRQDCNKNKSSSIIIDSRKLKIRDHESLFQHPVRYRLRSMKEGCHNGNKDTHFRYLGCPALQWQGKPSLRQYDTPHKTFSYFLVRKLKRKLQWKQLSIIWQAPSIIFILRKQIIQRWKLGNKSSLISITWKHYS